MLDEDYQDDGIMTRAAKGIIIPKIIIFQKIVDNKLQGVLQSLAREHFKPRLELVKRLRTMKRAGGWCEPVDANFELIHELSPEHE